ncbi:hypothetical protein MHBO_001661 [Bonamia ostreae]|uniref:Uncharacterized protein n=1 Tax=Bonamia ostreae TaxID=126728 RepID=A0ABV2AJV6_9EUKA
MKNLSKFSKILNKIVVFQIHLTDKKFIIFRSKFKSNLAETYLVIDGYYDFFYLIENSSKKMLLEFRISLDGYWGELIWIGKGIYFSGSLVLEIFKSIKSSLGIFLFYLFDDSKIELSAPVTVNSNRKNRKSMALRVLKLVCEQIPLTWYQRYLGVYPSICKNWKKLSGKTISQNPTRYNEAVKTIRGTNILSFCKITHPYTLETIQKLCEKYICGDLSVRRKTKTIVKSEQDESKRSLKLIIKNPLKRRTHATVHELGSKIMTKYKNTANKTGKNALLDLIEFYDCFLNLETVELKSDRGKYINCLRYLHNVQIFQSVSYDKSKNFKDTSKTLFNMKFKKIKILQKKIRGIDNFVVN